MRVPYFRKPPNPKFVFKRLLTPNPRGHVIYKMQVSESSWMPMGLGFWGLGFRVSDYSEVLCLAHT